MILIFNEKGVSEFGQEGTGIFDRDSLALRVNIANLLATASSRNIYKILLI